MSDHAGPLNLHYAARHARIALERVKAGRSRRRYDGHLIHVVYRLTKELDLIEKMLGKHWRVRLRRGKYR